MGGLHPYQAVSRERRLRAPPSSRCPTTPSDSSRMLRHGPGFIIKSVQFCTAHVLIRLCNNLPARARSQFGRHLARGGSAGKKDRVEERTRRRAARDCREGAECLRGTLRRMCTPTCDLFCSATLHIGGLEASRAAENEIMSRHRYDTRCVRFRWELAEFCSGIVGFCKRRLTWFSGPAYVT